MSRSISRPKTNFPGVACIVILYDHCTAYAIEVRILLHGETVSNVTLARYLVLSMLLKNWWILSKIAFYCGFLIVVHVGLTETYLINEMDFLLNLDPFLRINFHSLWYLDSHNLLNTWDILDEDLSMIGTSTISNHPVSGLIKVMNNSWISFVIISLSVCINLAGIFYAPMRYTHTVFFGVKV